MDFLFFLLMVFAIYVIVTTGPNPEKPKATNGKVIKVVKERFCPPHKWSWVDMIDQDGKKIGEKMVCALCGPLQSQSGREE